MIAEGVATKADGLSVRVKVNEAEMTLTKVEDGLSLARMLLCQLCGIDLSSPITLADEDMEDIPLLTTDTHFDMSTAYANRPEIRSLELVYTDLQAKSKCNPCRTSSFDCTNGELRGHQSFCLQ